MTREEMKRVRRSFDRKLDTAMIREHFLDLTKRGNITSKDIDDLRGNSWEWECLIPFLGHRLFIDRACSIINNCGRIHRPAHTYEESAQVHLMEALNRIDLLIRLEGKINLMYRKYIGEDTQPTTAAEKLRVIEQALGSMTEDSDALWSQVLTQGEVSKINTQK